MKFSFNFKGGIVKYPTERIVSKFLLFHLIPSIGNKTPIQEKIFFTSLRDGHIVDSAKFADPIEPQGIISSHKYETNDPVFKIFTLVEGFGVQKQFYSFFFTLDIHERETTILPLFSKDTSHSFQGKGRFLHYNEVKDILGEDSISYNFYQKQAPLPKAVFRRIVCFEAGSISTNPASGQIRKIRF